MTFWLLFKYTMQNIIYFSTQPVTFLTIRLIHVPASQYTRKLIPRKTPIILHQKLSKISLKHIVMISRPTKKCKFLIVKLFMMSTFINWLIFFSYMVFKQLFKSLAPNVCLYKMLTLFTKFYIFNKFAFLSKHLL